MRALIAQLGGESGGASSFPHPVAAAIGTSFLYARTIVW